MAIKARSDRLEERMQTLPAVRPDAATPLNGRRSEALAELRRVAKAYVSRTSEPSAEPPIQRTEATAAAAPSQERANNAVSPTLDDSVRLWRKLERSHERRRLLDRAEILTRDWLVHIASELEGEGAPFHRDFIEKLGSTQDSTRLVGLALDQLSRDWLRLVGTQVASGLPVPAAGSDWAAEMAAFLRSDATLANPGLEPSLIFTDRHLPRELLVEGLAKLAYFVKDSRVDTIVSLGRGGDILGDFMAAQGSAAKRHLIDWSSTRRAYRFGNIRRSDASGQRVFLIVDVARDVPSILNVHRELTARLVGAEIHYLALAGSAEVREAMNEQGITYVSNIVGDVRVDLPWNREGRYQVSKSSHVFGAGTEREWRVPVRELNRTLKDMKAE